MAVSVSSAVAPQPRRGSSLEPTCLATRLYFGISAALFLVWSWLQLTPLRLTSPGADIWQHLAALNALIADPINPVNPFAVTADSSRLFGSYWVAVASIGRVFGADALSSLIAASIFNLLLWFAAIWSFGRAIFGTSQGALALLAVFTGAWLFPPSFTGYHSPLAIVTGGAYPAFFLLGLTLLAWSATLRLLERNTLALAAALALLVAVGLTTHPFGGLVLMAGCGCFGLLADAANARARAGVFSALGAGAALSMLWPYYNPVQVLMSAGSAGWTTTVNFYQPFWLLQSLFPAIFGIVGLRTERARPLLILLAACFAGFLAGLTPLFPAGHRLLPYVVLLLHVGLAAVALELWSCRRTLIAATALVFAAVQLSWTVPLVARLHREVTIGPTLLVSAKALAGGMPPTAVVAGHAFAALPFAASGQPILATPFADPMIADLSKRQAASRALFDRRIGAEERLTMARSLGVSALAADQRSTDHETLRLLQLQLPSRSHGDLILFLVPVR